MRKERRHATISYRYNGPSMLSKFFSLEGKNLKTTLITRSNKRISSSLFRTFLPKMEISVFVIQIRGLTLARDDKGRIPGTNLRFTQN